MKYIANFNPETYHKIITVPNLVTGSGIAIILLYLFLILNGWSNSLWILILPCLAGASDLLDGHLARKLDQCSWLGERIDPMRDRLLFLAIFIHLIKLRGWQILLCPALGLVVVFEVIIGWGAIKFFPKNIPFRVHIIGKLRQALHVGIVFSLVFFEITKESTFVGWKFLNQFIKPLAGDLFSTFSLMVMASAATLMVYAIDYFLRVRPQKI